MFIHWIPSQRGEPSKSSFVSTSPFEPGSAAAAAAAAAAWEAPSLSDLRVRW